MPPVQEYPDSTVQEDEQPSPDEVFPSSQASDPALLPFPQSFVQVSAVIVEPPVQVYPDSTVQVDEQPSPEEVFPSSQVSDPVLLPFPQSFEQVHLLVEVYPDHVQVQPV